MSTIARYSGRCAVTTRSYDAGATIYKSLLGWAIDDDLAEAAEEAIRAHASRERRVIVRERTQDHYDVLGEGFQGCAIGDVLADEEHGHIVVLALRATAQREEYDDFGDAKTRWTIWARPATAEEAAPAVEDEEAAQEAQAAEAEAASKRAEAERTLLAMPREAIEKPGGAPHERVMLSGHRSTIYARYTDALIYHRYLVVLAHYDGDGGVLTYSRVRGDGVDALARAAAVAA